jgi:hypothetical protein
MAIPLNPDSKTSVYAEDTTPARRIALVSGLARVAGMAGEYRSRRANRSRPVVNAYCGAAYRG